MPARRRARTPPPAKRPERARGDASPSRWPVKDKAALRSLFELKDVDQTKPLALYFGPKPPAGQENRWIKTNPGQGWFAYFRIYGPEAAAFDTSWKPGDFQRSGK